MTLPPETPRRRTLLEQFIQNMPLNVYSGDSQLKKRKPVFQPSKRDKWQQFDDIELRQILKRRVNEKLGGNMDVSAINETERSSLIELLETLEGKF